MASNQQDQTKRHVNSANYLMHWTSNATNFSQDTNEGRESRRDNHENLVNDFYNNSTDFTLEVWGQSFHFCRFPRGAETMKWCMARHEHYMAHRLSLREGMTVLDVGCGVGSPAKEFATFAGCQIAKGREFAREEGIGRDVVEFVESSFMRIPFPDNSFDAVYAIEATVHAPDLKGVYKEIVRVLKLGGRFGMYEWVTLGPFDELNPRHLELRYGIERGNGMAYLRSAAEAQETIKEAGLEGPPLPWWYAAAGERQHAQTWGDWGTVIRMTSVGRILLDLAIRGMELVRYAPPGTAKMAKELIYGGDCIVGLGKKGMFTPMYFMVALKLEK
ncbi:sterol 24-C-methyltransferase [Lojkania enalia]|uniref:Sterol 24-C-methyltransferase n=1 Tax=Lojkania enalia TaxID=147567 RepID=A0A9P4N8P6_9PLEO|nr:sterol 24-C-methyltransferase [Didymosphaeria enalia]